MPTLIPKKKEITRKWRLVDAKGKVLGKIATKIADTLRGKNKPIFTKHLDCGDFVIVINAKHLVLTGKKVEKKQYYSHSRYFGNLKITTPKRLLEKRPGKIIYDAVYGMIPRNKLRDGMMKRLKIYPEETHLHQAQKPETMI